MKNKEQYYVFIKFLLQIRTAVKDKRHFIYSTRIVYMDEIVCNYGYITECMYICKTLLMQLI